jgi:hypothetical protein
MSQYHWYSSPELWLVVIPLFFAGCFGLGLAIANRSYNRVAPRRIRSHQAQVAPSRRAP